MTERCAVTAVDSIAWKQFRFCPAILGVLRGEWTVRGYNANRCFPVVGALRIPANSRLMVSDLDRAMIKVDQALLLPETLTRVVEKDFRCHTKQQASATPDLDLGKEDGVLSSLHELAFTYVPGQVMRPLNKFAFPFFAAGGLFAYQTRADAIQYESKNVNADSRKEWTDLIEQ